VTEFFFVEKNIFCSYYYIHANYILIDFSFCSCIHISTGAQATWALNFTQLLVLWQRSFCSQLGRSASYNLQMLVANICTQLSLSMNSSSKLGANLNLPSLAKDGSIEQMG